MLWAAGIGIAFVVGTTGLSLAAYFVMRLVAGGDPDGQTKDLANSVIIRIASLHALILALVFAQEMLSYEQLKTENAAEANAIADVYFDASRYHADGVPAIQDPLYEYVRIVLGQEWGRLGETGHLMQAAWDQWDRAYSGVLDLTATTDRERSLRAHMLEQVQSIAKTRVRRENHEAFSISGMFWFAAVAGVVFIALAYYCYPPTGHNVMLIGMLGAFTGVILFFIYAFANPYGEPGALQPTAHQRLLEQLDGARAAH